MLNLILFLCGVAFLDAAPAMAVGMSAESVKALAVGANGPALSAKERERLENLYYFVGKNRFDSASLEKVAKELAAFDAKHPTDPLVGAVVSNLILNSNYLRGNWYEVRNFVPGSYFKARAALESRFPQGNDEFLANIQMAQLTLFSKDYTKVEPYLKNAERIKGKTFDYYFYSGVMEEQRKRFDMANKMFDEADKLAKSPEKRTAVERHRELIAESTGNWGGMEQSLKRAIEVNPIAQNYGNLGNFYCRRTFRFEEGVEQFRKALSIASYGVAREGLACCLVKLADTQFNKKNYHLAAQNVQEALQMGIPCEAERRFANELKEKIILAAPAEKKSLMKPVKAQ